MLISNLGIHKLNGKRAKRTDGHNLSDDCKYKFKKLNSEGLST